MVSKTKTTLSLDQINQISTKVFQQEVESFYVLEKGFYNTAYVLILKDFEVILKIAPAEHVEILTYEKDIMKREIKVFNILKDLDVPTPTIYFVDFSKEVFPFDYYVMEKLEGQTLFDLWGDDLDKTPYYKELMMYLARINNVTMNQFGYDNLQTHPKSYQDTFLLMFDNLLQDGLKKDVTYKFDIHDLTRVIKKHSALLQKVTIPQLLHFDLWDGNLFTNNGKVTGILDLERSFNGPAIAEFAALHIDPFLQENKQFVDIYNQYADNKITLNEESRIIYLLHKTYLFLIMVVEVSYRDIEGSFDSQLNWSNEVIQELYKELKEKE